MASLPSASFAARGGQGRVSSAGLSTEPVGQRHPHSYLSHAFCAHTLTDTHSALCSPTATTTSTSSGPFITPVAPLGRANGMAGLLVLERDVTRRVEQRAEDGSLIDSGVGCVELGGGVALWSLAHVAVSLLFFHPSAPPHPPFSYFPPSYLLCVSVSLVSTAFMSLPTTPVLLRDARPLGLWLDLRPSVCIVTVLKSACVHHSFYLHFA